MVSSAQIYKSGGGGGCFQPVPYFDESIKRGGGNMNVPNSNKPPCCCEKCRQLQGTIYSSQELCKQWGGLFLLDQNKYTRI